MKRQRATQTGQAIRAAYEQHGADRYYQQFGEQYRNPHEAQCRAALHAALERRPPAGGTILDLACGSGEMTLALREAGYTVEGMDPFTGCAYLARTGQLAEALSFEAICEGALEGRRYSLIVCSFALHLAEPSRLPLLAYRLSLISDGLLVLTPHKRPHLRPEWGWTLREELQVERVRARFYTSTFPCSP